MLILVNIVDDEYIIFIFGNNDSYESVQDLVFLFDDDDYVEHNINKM